MGREPKTEQEPREAPLQELEPDHLSVFLYLAFNTKDLLALFNEIDLTVKGYRVEKLWDAEKADVLAAELKEYPEVIPPVTANLRKIYRAPALQGLALTPAIAQELAGLAVEEDAMVRLLWRILSDADKEVRAKAAPALATLVERYYKGPANSPPVEPDKEAAPGKGPKGEAADLARARADVTRLRQEQEGFKAELAKAKEREGELKASVKEFRAAVAAAEKAAGAAAADRDAMARRLEELERDEKKAAAKSTLSELAKAKKALARLEAVEERLAAAEKERDELGRKLHHALKAREESAKEPPKPAASGDDEPAEPAPTTWVVPNFTREFYQSLERFPPGLQRLAFKQALLLAENHRHPSLRAIPLEGLPSYYRVRVASDVRLIYRRVDKDVEILSLIDREDLERYVRQAKTR